MFRLKGSREGSHSGSLQRYMKHQEDIRTIRGNNTQDDLQKDLKELIGDISKGKYGNPENWIELRNDLIHLADFEDDGATMYTETWGGAGPDCISVPGRAWLPHLFNFNPGVGRGKRYHVRIN